MFRAKPSANWIPHVILSHDFSASGCLCRSATRTRNAADAAILVHTVPPETPLVRCHAAPPHRRRSSSLSQICCENFATFFGGNFRRSLKHLNHFSKDQLRLCLLSEGRNETIICLRYACDQHYPSEGIGLKDCNTSRAMARAVRNGWVRSYRWSYISQFLTLAR